jgi:hypothetical protein
MASNTTFTSGAILTAAQMNALPWGIVTATAGGTSGAGYVARTAGNLTVTTSLADLTGMTITWTAQANTVYRVTWSCYGTKNTAAGYTAIYVADGTSTIQGASAMTVGAGENFNLSGSVIMIPAAGSVTAKLQGLAENNTSTVTASGGGNPCTLIVEKIGTL